MIIEHKDLNDALKSLEQKLARKANVFKGGGVMDPEADRRYRKIKKLREELDHYPEVALELKVKH